MWVVTRVINQYNQDGDYLYTVYNNKPTKEQLMQHFDAEYSEHLLKGGGRIGVEYIWYFLTELKEGEEYQSKL